MDAMPGDILETIDNALADCMSADAMRWCPPGNEERPVRAGSSASMLELCSRAYSATGGRERQDSRTCWVMDLASYKQIRAECEAFNGRRTDPDTWVPDPGDQLFGIRIEVRGHGGGPHLETPARAAGV